MADTNVAKAMESSEAKRGPEARQPGGGEYLIAATAPGEVFTPEDFTEEQKAIGDSTEGFVKDQVWPVAEALERHEFQHAVALMRACGQLGLLAIDVPEAYGGLELDKATSMLAAEKIAPAGAFSVTYSAHSGIATLPLVYYGTAAQKEKYLTKLASGEWIGAYCLTEPGSGSDALGARTTARLSADGTHYLLEGTKQFITNGAFADLFTVFAKVDGEHFTAFLVERTFEGVTVGPEEKKLGIKGSSTTQVILENAKVPIENVLGEIGKGHKIAFNVLNVGRFKLGAAVTGAAKHVLGEGAKYANLRQQFGTPIGKFGAIQQKLGEGAASIFASESVIYRLAGLLDRRLSAIPKDAPGYYDLYQKGIEDYAIECAIAKVFCSEVLAGVADEVVQIHGGYGFTQEYPAERFYRDERINRIFEGTNEINRLLIPGTLLRRAMKGEIPLQREVMKAVESLLSPSLDEQDDSRPFAAEEAALASLKKVFLVVAGAAVQKFRGALKDEQEVLLALADVAIELFAVESALLRAEKGTALPERTRALMAAAVKVFTFGAVERIGTAARKAAFSVSEGDDLSMLLAGIRRLTKYDASGLLPAQRLLAAAVLEGEKYPW